MGLPNGSCGGPHIFVVWNRRGRDSNVLSGAGLLSHDKSIRIEEAMATPESTAGGNQSSSPVRGLATLALLQVSYDAGKDYLSMYSPFVLDTIRVLEDDGFSTAQLQEALRERHSFHMPTDPLKRVLSRAKKNGQVKRQGGRYFRTKNIYRGSDIIDIQREREIVERKHDHLAEALVDYLTHTDAAVCNPSEALSILTAFLRRFETEVLLGEEPPVSTGVAPLQAARVTAQVAKFVEEICFPSDDLRSALESLLQGIVLQNALFLRDIASPKKEFESLKVYLDSIPLLHAIGVAGETAQRATREALDLMTEANASLLVFERTVREMKRILQLYERKLATQEGRRDLHRTEITSFFLNNHYTPSQVRQIISLLPRQIDQLGVRVVTTPSRKRHTTYSEGLLAQRLSGPDSSPTSDRVQHDVNCAAAILTMRRGRVPQSIEDCRHVFATSSGRVISTIERWAEDEGLHGVPPFVNYRKIANIAWLRNPDIKTDMPVHELAALCTAAIRPPDALWQAFTRHLRELRDSKVITSDEEVAVVVQDITDRMLVDYVDEIDDFDADDTREVVRRVQESLKGEAQQDVAEARQREAEEREARRELELHLRGKADAVARWMAHGIAGLLTVIVIGGTYAGITYGANKPTWALIAVGLAGAIAVIGQIFGGHVTKWHHRINMWFRRKCRKSVFGRAEVSEKSG